MRTHNIPSYKRKSKGILIMPPGLALELTLISSNYPCLKHFHGSEGFQAIEVLLYMT